MDNLSNQTINLLKNAFEAFDQDRRGCIPTGLVGTILELLGHGVTEKQLATIIEEVDVDSSGELEFEEFVCLVSRFLVDDEEEDEDVIQEELREAFRLYDKEDFSGYDWKESWYESVPCYLARNGYITTDVLREILREVCCPITEEELDEMIEEMDRDGSGTLDLDEVMECMMCGDD